MSEDRKSEIPAGGYSICEHGIPSYASTPCSRCGGFVAGEASGAGDLCLCEEQSSGTDLIAAERQRQVDREGWTPEHDDTHSDGALADAAACLAATEPIYVQRSQASQGYRYSQGQVFVSPWPYERNEVVGSSHPWRRKPRDADRLGDLAKAGALIAAEIDRLQRAALLAALTVPESDTESDTNAAANGVSVPDDRIRLEADLAALREAAQAVVDHGDSIATALAPIARDESDQVMRELIADWDERAAALRAVLASADSESREETP